MDNLSEFVEESNMIERICSSSEDEIMKERLKLLLKINYLRMVDITRFNYAGELRDKIGMDVRIGRHIPQRGGPQITADLENLLSRVNSGMHPYLAHVEFEILHPFIDGNGRTGRAIWLWQMVNQRGYDNQRLFLHEFYYQSLEFSR